MRSLGLLLLVPWITFACSGSDADGTAAEDANGMTGGSGGSTENGFAGMGGGSSSTEECVYVPACGTAPLWLSFGRSRVAWEDDVELKVTVDGEDYVCGFGSPSGEVAEEETSLVCKESNGRETDFVTAVLFMRVILDVGPEWQFSVSIQGMPPLVEVVLRQEGSEPQEYQFEPTYEPVCSEEREVPPVLCATEFR